MSREMFPRLQPRIMATTSSMNVPDTKNKEIKRAGAGSKRPKRSAFSDSFRGEKQGKAWKD